MSGNLQTLPISRGEYVKIDGRLYRIEMVGELVVIEDCYTLDFTWITPEEFRVMEAEKVKPNA